MRSLWNCPASSFTSSSMTLTAAACLNVADDHLDWHGSRAEYEAAKGRIYRGVSDRAVYNAQDDTTRRLATTAPRSPHASLQGFTRLVTRGRVNPE